jgi:hypothetical protein
MKRQRMPARISGSWKPPVLMAMGEPWKKTPENPNPDHIQGFGQAAARKVPAAKLSEGRESPGRDSGNLGSVKSPGSHCCPG